MNRKSEEGFDKIERAMRDDAGGLGNYSACLFGDAENKLSFLYLWQLPCIYTLSIRSPPSASQLFASPFQRPSDTVLCLAE